MSQAASSVAAPDRRLLLSVQRLVWCWTDVIGCRGVAPEVLALVVFALLYGSAALISLFGELDIFLRDFRWPFAYGGVAWCAFYLVYLPGQIDRVWVALRPWILNPEEEVSDLRESSRKILTGGVPFCVALWVAFSITWGLTNSWSIPYKEHWQPQLLNALFAPFLWYFAGIAMAVATVGLRSLVTTIATRLEFSPNLVYPAGRRGLHLLHRLLTVNWLFFAVVTLCATMATTPLSGEAGAIRDDGYTIPDLLVWVLLVAIALILVSTQRALDTLLGRLKAGALTRLNQRLDEIAELPEDVSALDVVKKTHLLHVVTYEIQKVEAFTPTLVDGRFVLQVALSASAILIANIVLRLALTN